MTAISLIGYMLFGLGFLCSVMSLRRQSLGWASCLCAVIASLVLLYEGASYELLGGGALVLALPLLWNDHRRSGT